MYPLTMMERGKARVLHITGNDKARIRLEDLGFVPGQEIRVLQRIKGNMIIKINDSRIALDESSAVHILIEEEK